MKRLWTWLPLGALLLLAFTLPFELNRPLWGVAGLSVTNVELLLYGTLGLTAVAVMRAPEGVVWPGRYWLWLLPFTGALFLAALLAPELRLNAFKAAWRLLAGILLALAVMQLIRRPAHGRYLVLALLAGGLIAALAGLWEAAFGELAGAGLFRTHLTRVGSFHRLTATFDYANQAAMFLEATLPFLVALGWVLWTRRPPSHQRTAWLAGLVILTLLYLQALVLTLSRAGFVVILATALLLAGWLAYRQAGDGRRLAYWWLGLAIVTAVIAASNMLISDQLRLRLLAGNVDAWYQARIDAPDRLEMAGGGVVNSPVTVTNEGALVWESDRGRNPILLGARWINQESGNAHGELRWAFPGDVRPGQVVQMVVPVSAPLRPGPYELRWDVVQEQVTWFGNKSGRYAVTAVTIIPGDPAAEPLAFEQEPLNSRTAWDYAGPVPNRTTLWTVALAMVGERPWLGIGLDNYRRLYGLRLGLPYFDDTVHSNSFYLELLVSLGVAGAIPFFLWAAGLLLDIGRTLSLPQPSIWPAALAAGLLAFFIHGLLDYFLLFNATGLLFWLLVGLWASKQFVR